MSDLAAAFRAARRYDAEDVPDDAPATAAEVALRLLHYLAEDPLVCGRYRMAARRHLRRLREAMTAWPARSSMSDPNPAARIGT